MQARTLLAIVATLQLLTICLNFTLASYVIWLTLPFAALAFFGVFLAIYCGWRTGIWVFMGECRRGVGGQGSPGENSQGRRCSGRRGASVASAVALGAHVRACGCTLTAHTPVHMCPPRASSTRARFAAFCLTSLALHSPRIAREQAATACSSHTTS